MKPATLSDRNRHCACLLQSLCAICDWCSTSSLATNASASSASPLNSCIACPPPLTLPSHSTLAVLRFPVGAALFGDAPANFAAVAAIGVATSFTSTLMFTALGSFYNRWAGGDDLAWGPKRPPERQWRSVFRAAAVPLH